MESLLKKANELGVNGNKPIENLEDIDGKKNNHIMDNDDCKFVADCKLALEQTQALASANPQLFRSEDYVRIESFLLNILNRRISSSCHLNHCCNSEGSKVDIRCRCFIQDMSSREDNCLYEKNENCTVRVNFKHDTNNLESKGICSYVAIVVSYVIFLFFVTFLLSQIGKI